MFVVVIKIALHREAYLTIDSNDDVIAFHSYSDTRHIIIVNTNVLTMLVIINIVVTAWYDDITNTREGEDSSINPCHIAKVLTFYFFCILLLCFVFHIHPNKLIHSSCIAQVSGSGMDRILWEDTIDIMGTE